VDYAAKWLPDSFAYQNTPRVIPARLTRRQADAVRQLALGAWHAMGCRGYARVDMRLNAAGRPQVLEVNPNPDISLDAGFAAALEAGGIPYEEFVEAAIEVALANQVEDRS
jgi:D-alanine-D-alanine ligase